LATFFSISFDRLLAGTSKNETTTSFSGTVCPEANAFWFCQIPPPVKDMVGARIRGPISVGLSVSGIVTHRGKLLLLSESMEDTQISLASFEIWTSLSMKYPYLSVVVWAKTLTDSAWTIELGEV